MLATPIDDWALLKQRLRQRLEGEDCSHIAKVLDGQASEERAKVAARQQAAWKDWVADAVKSGGSKAHKWVRSSTVRVQRAPPGDARSAQKIADDALADWNVHWGGDVTDEFQGVWPQFAELDRPSIEDFRKVARSFRAGSGLNFDRLHPRSLALLDDADVELVIDLLLDIERLGQVPSVWLTLVVLIDKADGGKRPIGLLPSLLRLLGRLRRGHVKSWEASARSKFHADRCDRANWDAALMSEYAAASGLSEAS